MKTIIHQLFAILLVAALAPCLVAQENDPNLEKLAGTWTLDVEKTAESMENDEEAQMMRQMAAQMKLQMIFRADGTLDMMQGEQEMPGNPSFTLSAKEGEENTFDIEITRDDQDDPMVGTIKFADDNTIHVTPENESTIVMVREVEVVDPEKAGEFFAGRWNANEEATKKMIEENDDLEMPTDREFPDVFVEFDEEGNAKLGEGGRDPMNATFTVEAGEEDNTFVLTISADGGPGDIKINATVLGKNRVKLQPEEEELPLILDRAK